MIIHANGAKYYERLTSPSEIIQVSSWPVKHFMGLSDKVSQKKCFEKLNLSGKEFEPTLRIGFDILSYKFLDHPSLSDLLSQPLISCSLGYLG